jgi:hypothetical protein
MNREEWNGELQIGGIYQLIDGEVVGELTTELISRSKDARLSGGCSHRETPGRFLAHSASRYRFACSWELQN